jgi:hypothetical protein
MTAKAKELDPRNGVSEHKPVALREDGHVNDLARTLHGLLDQKIGEAPWKAQKIMKLKRRVAVVALTDGDQAATIEAGFGELGIRSGMTSEADLLISVPHERLGLLAGVPLGPGHFPALWRGDGRALVGAILSRQIRVKGLVTRPRFLVSVLTILGVP